jgi:hypothetical protein
MKSKGTSPRGRPGRWLAGVALLLVVTGGGCRRAPPPGPELYEREKAELARAAAAKAEREQAPVSDIYPWQSRRPRLECLPSRLERTDACNSQQLKRLHEVVHGKPRKP